MTDETAARERGDSARPELLTDRQAAERMGWSCQKVQRLRLTGKLPFYPGRPPLIEPADLELLKVGGPAAVDPAGRPLPRKQELDEIEQRARRAWLRNKFERS